MQFRLTYQGPLLAARSDQSTERARTPEKHRIRRIFHKQLKKLWHTNPNLIQRTKVLLGDTTSYVENAAENWKENGFRFVPLVTKNGGLSCKLEILLLRAAPPGGVLQQNCDIDNRLKTLFDTLQKPDGKGQLGDAVPGDDEDPFFVLVQDDRLITHLAVDTDTLLQPVSEVADEQVNDVRLVITCTVWPYSIGVGNMELI